MKKYLKLFVPISFYVNCFPVLDSTHKSTNKLNDTKSGLSEPIAQTKLEKPKQYSLAAIIYAVNARRDDRIRKKDLENAERMINSEGNDVN